jgi:hypothetical protein
MAPPVPKVNSESEVLEVMVLCTAVAEAAVVTSAVEEAALMLTLAALMPEAAVVDLHTPMQTL